MDIRFLQSIMMRRLFSSRLVLRRLFSEGKEVAEEVALTKAGFLLQKTQPKNTFVKKGLFVKPQPKEGGGDQFEKLDYDQTKSEETKLDSIDTGMEPKSRRQPRKEREQAKDKGPRAALPTAAEVLKDEIAPYDFPSR
jgi:hypothetical protein